MSNSDLFRILVVDDDLFWKEYWGRREFTAEKGFSVISVDSIEAAEILLDKKNFDGAIFDKGEKRFVPEKEFHTHDGIEFIKFLRKEQPFCRIALVTAEEFSREVFD
jgi:DNA-binding response OmpR family regulator